MKTLPSKELLSEVLKNETKGLKSFGLSECAKYIIFQYEDFDDSINIYELTHKFKEWAKSKGYVVILTYHFDTVAVILSIDGNNVYSSPPMTVLHELEAMSKACEWILEQIR